MKKIIFNCFIIFFFAGCVNKNTQTPSQQNTDSMNVDFFPVTQFFKGQLAELDSFPVTPLLIKSTDIKDDSIWLQKKEILPWFQPFLSSEINKNNLTEFFKATKFNDQSINAITFTYTAKKDIPDSIKIRHWDIYINPETGKIIKIYIVKMIDENDKSYTQQLIWQTGKWAKITSFLNSPDGNMVKLKEEKLIWNFTEY